MQDKLKLAGWKIQGVKDILLGLESSDLFADTPAENIFFALVEELQQARNLLNEVAGDVD